MLAGCLGKDTVSKEHQNNEVGAEEHATVVNTTMGANACVHYFVPVLSCQNLQQAVVPSYVMGAAQNMQLVGEKWQVIADVSMQYEDY